MSSLEWEIKNKTGILIKICAPIQEEEILSLENQFYKNLMDFVAMFNAF